MVMSIAVEEASTGKRVFWGAPTFDQVRIGWEETEHACGGVAKFNQTLMAAAFPSGGKIIYRSLDDPDNARGHTADGIVIDEVQNVKPSAWYEVLQPMLVDTHGWAWFIGTPNGRNWFFREHLGACDRLDSMAWQVPTLGVEIRDGELLRKPHPLENPDISFEEIKRIWQTTPSRSFEEEILAIFKEGEGAVFRNLAACMGAPPTTPDAHAGHELVAGLDWAKQNDFTAISILCKPCACEVARDRFNKIDYHFQRDRLRALYDRWHVTRIIGEANSIGGPNIEELQRDGLRVQPFETTGTSKPPLIESLSLSFERAEIQWQSDPIWTAELEAYEMRVSPTTGRTSYSAPDGVHDDTVIARALALYGVQRRGMFIG